MDVGVLCSVAVETLSLSALEMMAMGVPMVMSNTGGATGRLFPVGDTSATVEHRAALTDRRQSFTVEQMTDRYETLFRSLLAQ